VAKPRKTRILHLEDSDLDAELVRAALRDGGIDAEIVRVDSREGFAAVLEDPFDLILADYSLPAFDGLQALEEVKRAGLDTPFIFVSGVLGEETAIETLKRGATDYVLKQRLGRLVPSVQRALGEALERGGRRRAEHGLRRSEQRFRVALQNAPIAVFNQDVKLRYTWVHSADPLLNAERLLGRTDADVFDAANCEHLTRLKRAVLHSGSGMRAEIELPFDGAIRTYDLTIEPLRDAGAEVIGLTAAAVDITERRAAHRRLIAEHAITRILAEAHDLESHVRVILEVIASSLDCDLGQWWRIKEPSSESASDAVLCCSEAWIRPDSQLESFHALSRRTEFPLGIGLPGRVWSSGKPVSIPDVTVDTNFPRSAQASQARLRTGVAFPILIGTQCLGVMEFFARRVFEPDPALMDMMAAVGSEIGQFIQRQRAEAALRESEERYRFLAESIPEIVWTAGPQGDFDYFNRRWYEYSGLTVEQSRGSEWQAAVHPADLDRCRDAWEQALAKAEAFEVEFRLRRAADGAYRWHLGRAVPMTWVGSAAADLRGGTVSSGWEGEAPAEPRFAGRLPDDSPLTPQHSPVPIVRWFGTCTDVDDQRRAAEALRKSRTRLRALVDELARSNKELDDFAYIASHDLKEPLRGIHNYAGFLLEDYGQQFDAEGRAKVETLIRLTQRMDDLIDSLLEYSRIGRVEPDLGENDLNQLVAEVLDSLHISLQQREIDVRLPRSLPIVRCDRLYVAEIFRNLITNAMKYNDKERKWIEIGYLSGSGLPRLPGGNGDDDLTTVPTPEPPANLRVFFVRDNGIGIRPEHGDSVFRMFRRLHGREEFGGGTGSGLTICKKIVERHGGRIWFESTPQEGSTFYFTLEDYPYAAGRAMHPVG
jgi:PAS domain S-box-containing protein